VLAAVLVTVMANLAAMLVAMPVALLPANQLRFAEPVPSPIDMTLHFGNQNVDVIVVKVEDERAMKHHVKDAWFAAL